VTVQDESTTLPDESTTLPTNHTAHGAVLTDAAASKAKSLLDQEGRDDLALRIAVQPGGCAGLRYNLFFDDPRSTVTSPSTSAASP
jgi:Fe-S cluster assembly iron-binding protein IscA